MMLPDHNLNAFFSGQFRPDNTSADTTGASSQLDTMDLENFDFSTFMIAPDDITTVSTVSPNFLQQHPQQPLQLQAPLPPQHQAYQQFLSQQQYANLQNPHFSADVSLPNSYHSTIQPQYLPSGQPHPAAQPPLHIHTLQQSLQTPLPMGSFHVTQYTQPPSSGFQFDSGNQHSLNSDTKEDNESGCRSDSGSLEQTPHSS